MDNIYADRVGNIMISNGIARLDFLTLNAVNQETNQGDFERTCRLNIPVDGLMQAIDVLEKLKADLLQQQQTNIQQNTEQDVKDTQRQPKKLTREEFDKLPQEQQEKIRQRAKLKEKERLRQQLNQ